MFQRLICIIFLFVTNSLFAQQTTLEIKGTAPHLFLSHSVQPKESLYSLGRMYNVPPKALASYNNLRIETGLDIGQEIKIPLDKNNFVQSEKVTGAGFIPLYHTVTEKETLYRIGLNYNKVSLTNIKQWNHLTSDRVSAGKQLIVGYLKVDKSQSALARNNAAPVSRPIAPPTVVAPAEKAAESKPAVVKQTEMVPEKSVVKEEKVVKPAEEKVVSNTQPSHSTINFNGGFFKKMFDQQFGDRTTNTGTGGTFKSTSGWQDGKYYCFNNDAAPGTVIKINNPATNKSVYAKVLDAIPEIKQNSGMMVIISNAAAEELGATENFNCEISFAK